MFGSIIFVRWRQYWHHLANTIELVLPLAHQSPHPKQQIVQFSHYCTAHGKNSLFFTMGAPFPKNCPYPCADLDPHLKRFIGLMRAHNPMHLDQFSRFCTDDRRVPLYFTMGHPFPLKIAPSHGGIWTSSNTSVVVLKESLSSRTNL